MGQPIPRIPAIKVARGPDPKLNCNPVLTLFKTECWDRDGGGWNIGYTSERGRIKPHVNGHPKRFRPVPPYTAPSLLALLALPSNLFFFVPHTNPTDRGGAVLPSQGALLKGIEFLGCPTDTCTHTHTHTHTDTQDRRIYSVLRAGSGHLLRDRTAIARELVAHWSQVMVGGEGRSEEECYGWLQRKGPPA